MRVQVGTSGFSYPQWRGSFYPDRLPPARMLAFYAARFTTVEINTTFYGPASRATLERWAAEVPPAFAFALKAPRRITHELRLRGAGDLAARFLASAAVLGEHLGPILFQLPPNLRADVPLLRDFLDTLPAHRRVAFEFRHASWQTDAVRHALDEHGQALCFAETDETAGELVATATWGYLRLRRAAYDDRALEAWAARLEKQPWQEAFVFFKHAGEAPALAMRLEAAIAPLGGRDDGPAP